jgi:hypothetical protein
VLMCERAVMEAPSLPPAAPASPRARPGVAARSLVERDRCVGDDLALQVDKPLQLRHVVDSRRHDGLEDLVRRLHRLGGCGMEGGGREGPAPVGVSRGPLLGRRAVGDAAAIPGLEPAALS